MIRRKTKFWGIQMPWQAGIPWGKSIVLLQERGALSGVKEPWVYIIGISYE
jgi:hypothetical protein